MRILILLLLYVGRRNKVVNSLVDSNHILGRSGIVEIPFDVRSKGKVRINLQDHTMEFVAFTDEPKVFSKGDKVFVVEMKGNKVGVVAEDSL